MKKIVIVSYDVSGWAMKDTQESARTRLEKGCEFIRDNVPAAAIIALQCVQLSGGSNLDVFKANFPEYDVILPKGYSPDRSPRSCISIILVKNTIVKGWSAAEVRNLEDWLIYNYVTLNIVIEQRYICFKMMNVSVPALPIKDNVYAVERRCDIKKIEKEILNVALAQNKAYYSVVGNLGDDFGDLVKEFADYGIHGFITGNEPGCILYSDTIFMSEHIQPTKSYDYTVIKKLSKHPVLVGVISIED